MISQPIGGVSRVKNNKCLENNFNHQKPDFYARLFGESEGVPFEVTPVHEKFGVSRTPFPSSPNL